MHDILTKIGWSLALGFAISLAHAGSRSILARFVISGFLATFVPDSFWQVLFLSNASE